MASPTARYTREELESRNQKHDAMFVIDNVVYNVTEFLDDHPGGVEVLMDNAGRDASRCFHDVGHSEDARDWMKKFAVGEVAEADRWAVQRKESSWMGGEEGATAGGLLAAAWPPLLLTAVAAALYMYLFS